MLEITKMLTLSTAHISEDTAVKLNLESAANQMGLCVYPKSVFGWYIAVNLDDGHDSDCIPKCLLDCLNLAAELGCGLLCLDADGETVSFLPQYAW